jgi:hypothetical protein
MSSSWPLTNACSRPWTTSLICCGLGLVLCSAGRHTGRPGARRRAPGRAGRLRPCARRRSRNRSGCARAGSTGSHSPNTVLVERLKDQALGTAGGGGNDGDVGARRPCARIWASARGPAWKVSALMLDRSTRSPPCRSAPSPPSPCCLPASTRTPPTTPAPIPRWSSNATCSTSSLPRTAATRSLSTTPRPSRGPRQYRITASTTSATTRRSTSARGVRLHREAGRPARAGAAGPGQDQQESPPRGEAPMFQDTRLKVVVFPEVAVGDQLVVRYVMRRNAAVPRPVRGLVLVPVLRQQELPAGLRHAGLDAAACGRGRLRAGAVSTARRDAGATSGATWAATTNASKPVGQLPRLRQAAGGIDLCRLRRLRPAFRRAPPAGRSPRRHHRAGAPS